MGMLVAIIATMILLPVSSSELATYLLNVFQLTIVIISTQIAYELYFGSSFSIKHVFKKFLEVFATKERDDFNGILIDIAKQSHEVDEATGNFAAELTDVIVKKICN